MYVRCAFFEGRVKPGCEEDFAAYVREQLVPLWTRFPGAQEVRVLRQIESDTPDPQYAMVLAFAFPSLQAIEEALKSDVRHKSREVTKGLLPLFEGRIFHTVFKADHAVVLE